MARPPARFRCIQGNDVLDGGLGGDRMQGFSGDDIMLGQGGFDKFEGRLGFDWASWENEDHGVSVDMERREFVDQPQALGGDAIRDFFIETEAASGSAFSDFIQGTNDAKIDPFNELSNVNLIFGLADYFPAGPGGLLRRQHPVRRRRQRLPRRPRRQRHHRRRRPPARELTSRAAGGQIIREILYDQAEEHQPSIPSPEPSLPQETSIPLSSQMSQRIIRSSSATDAERQCHFWNGRQSCSDGHSMSRQRRRRGGVDDGIDTLHNIERLQFADVTIDNPLHWRPSHRPRRQGTLTIDNNGARTRWALIGPLSVATVTDVADPTPQHHQRLRRRRSSMVCSMLLPPASIASTFR